MIAGLPKGKVIQCTITDGKLQALKHYWPLSSYFLEGQTKVQVKYDSHPVSKILVDELVRYAKTKDISVTVVYCCSTSCSSSCKPSEYS